MKDWQFYLLLAFAIVIIASLVPVFKITLQEVSPEQITFVEYFFISIFFLVILFFKGKLPLIKEYKSKIHYFIPIAFFGLVCNRIFYLNSFYFIQATEANILYYTFPLSMAVLGFFILREKIKLFDIIGLLFGFVAAFIVITKFDFNLANISFVGSALAILGGVGYASYLVLSKKFRFDLMVLLFYSAFFSCIISAIYILLFSSFPVPSINGWLGLFYIGLVDAIGLFLVIELLRRKNTFKIANSFYAIPFLVVIFNYFILNEIIYSSYIIGLVLLVIGILIQNKGKWKKEN